MTVVVHSLDSDEPWRTLAPRLRDFLTPNGDGPIFCAPDWLHAAWQWQRRRARTCCLAAHSGDQLLGFVPLARTTSWIGALPCRTTHFVMVPDTQFADLLCRPGDARLVAAAIAQHLLSDSSQWDRLQLDYLSNRHVRWQSLADALRKVGVVVSVDPAGVNPYVDLAGSFDDYYDGRSRSLKKAVNLSANRLAKAGSISVEWVRDEARAAAGLAEAVRVSTASWKRETGNSLDQPGPRAFIDSLTARAAARGELSLWLLRLDDKVIATEYQLISGGNVHALRADFDPAHAAASPGTYLNHYLLERLFGQGLARYYMGPGNNAYKLKWSDLAEPMFRMTAFSPTVRGQMVRWIEQSAIPRARHWRSRIRGVHYKDKEGAQ